MQELFHRPHIIIDLTKELSHLLTCIFEKGAAAGQNSTAEHGQPVPKQAREANGELFIGPEERMSVNSLRPTDSWERLQKPP